jgi:hypothetical protein
MSHEIAEWLDDPNGSNPVPPWGAEGQVQAGSCQNNLEVGDPLSPGFGTPTNPFSVLMPNGVTYTLQELAYFSWFYGGASLGSGGLYSDNGTFTGLAWRARSVAHTKLGRELASLAGNSVSRVSER